MTAFTSQQQAVEFDYLTRVLKDVDIDVVEPEFASYVAYDGRRVFHACDDLHSGYEGGFCNGGLFFLTSARADLGYQGYSYSCKRHLRKLAFQFALTLEEKSLDREFDQWEDSLCRECGQPQDSSLEPHDHEGEILCPICVEPEPKHDPDCYRHCSLCGGNDGEHNREAHTAEAMRPAAWGEQP